MVRNIPTICIDGQITFVSRIPPRDELVAAIQKRVNEKFRLRIRQRRGSLIVLGTDNDQTQQTREVVERAVAELGAEVTVESVTDPSQFADYGLRESQTPAVVTAKYRTRSTTNVPEVAVVKEWIKDLQ